MYYTVYRTVNLQNQKFYVGVHVTEDPNDSYLGSGQALLDAIRKYGRASFKKEVLFVFHSPEKMAEKERELVTREFVEREDTYNLVPGGHQGDRWYRGWKLIPSELRSKNGKKGSEVWKTSPQYAEFMKRSGTRLAQQMRDEGRVPFDNFKGRKHSEDARRKMSEAKKGKYEGSKNPSFGSSWVCVPGEKEKRISATEVPRYLEEGWVRGRKSSSWSRVLDSLKDQ